MVKNLLLFVSLFTTLFLYSKEEIHTHDFNKCGTHTPSSDWENAFQKKIKEYRTEKLSNPNSKTTEESFVIPVIVHVIYNSADSLNQNISKAQIDSQIIILNRNYAGNSIFIDNVPGAFEPLIANTGITFCPAVIDPSGNVLAEPGIERIDRSSIGLKSPGNRGWTMEYIDASIKPITIWNPKYYLNIWVVPGISGGTLGYATFPGMTGLDGMPDYLGPETTDGVVCDAKAYGKGPFNYSSYSEGGTATHEVGHWLGLRHIWGDVECGNDFCDDTPIHKDKNFGCPTFPKMNTCGGAPDGEMFMNFMDYTDDYCNNMFTIGQSERMHVTLNNGTFRKSLINSTVCSATMQAPVANFIFNQTSTNICSNAVFDFTDKSMFNKNATSWAWTFQDGIPATSSSKNPSGITFSSPGNKSVTLTITTPLGTSTITKTINAIYIGNADLPLTENFEGNTFPPAGWAFIKRSADAEMNWEVREGSSGFGIGNKSMIYNNTEYDAKKKLDDILLPKVDLTGISQATIKFDVAYTPYYVVENGVVDTQDDILEVLLSSNCGTSVTSVYKKRGEELATFLPGKGEEFYPTSTQWRTDSIVIPSSFLGKTNVQVVFRNHGLWGHTIYVDNISITSPNVVVNNPAPKFTISDSAVCVNQSITLTNTTTGTIDSLRWEMLNGTPSTSTSTTTVTTAFATQGAYPIKLTVYKGTFSSSIIKNVQVSNKPVVSVTPNSSNVCPNTNTTLVASGATSYNWSTGQTGSSINVAPNTNTNYKVIGTTNGCKSDSAMATITVKPKPSISINATKTSICPGESVVITASGASSYNWNNGKSGASITETPTSTTTYKVVGVVDGCKSDSTSITITVKPKPTVTVNPASSTICNGQSVTLTASGATTYNWSTGESGSSIVVSPTSNSSYKVMGILSDCKSDSATATVTITNTNPTVTITKNPNKTTICEGESLVLTASGANNYTWSSGQNTNSITVTPTATTTYSVVGSLNGCPSLNDSDSVIITVNSKPTVGTIVRGGWDTIYVTPANGSSYNWYFNNSSSILAITTVPYYFATQNGNYAVQVVDSNNCKSNKSTNYAFLVSAIKNNAASIKLSIYPNPNFGSFFIELNATKHTTYQMKMVSASGAEVINETFEVQKGFNRKSVADSRISKDIYFLSLTNEDGVATFQILVQ